MSPFCFYESHEPKNKFVLIFRLITKLVQMLAKFCILQSCAVQRCRISHALHARHRITQLSACKTPLLASHCRHLASCWKLEPKCNAAKRALELNKRSNEMLLHTVYICLSKPLKASVRCGCMLEVFVTDHYWEK